MKKAEVSPEFMAFLGKNHGRIEEAKKAESRANNVPVPVGAQGTCILTDFKMLKSKDKTQQDGSIKEGTPYIEMHFRIIDNSEHQGKVLRKQWWFMDSAKMDAGGRFQIFLDDMERLGLPRELRQNHESPAELGDYFLSKEDTTFHFSIVYNQYNTLDDQKEIKLTTVQAHVPSTDAVVPPSAPSIPKPASTPASSSPSTPSKGTEVSYLEQKCVVVEAWPDSGKVHIKGIDNPGMEKIVKVENLD
jgi:hypothetical protein